MSAYSLDATEGEVLRRVRGLALSYGACSEAAPRGMTRSDLHRVLQETAHRLGIPADALIDDAVGPEWCETPPHPGAIRRDGESATSYRDRYSKHCSDAGRHQLVNVRCTRHGGEGLWEFACRFWNYRVPTP